MNLDEKCYDALKDLLNKYPNFNAIVKENLKTGKIRFFDNTEWNKINSQNFVSPTKDMKEFIDMFILGYNIGNCKGCAWQLSYSYNDVDIVSGILPILKGTKNALELGGHVWLENKNEIIDTTLMLVIDKSLKDKIGYVEEQRVTSYDLRRNSTYQARREFVLDKNLKNKKI